MNFMNNKHTVVRAARVLCALLALFALLAASSCVSPGENDDRPYIVCTVFPQYDFIRSIAGDDVRLGLLVPPGTQTHDFSIGSITMSNMNDLFGADLIVYAGGESDERLIKDLRGTLTEKTVFVALTELVSERLRETRTGGMLVGEDVDGTAEEEFDEHVWTSPKRAIEIVRGLLPYLSALLPESAELFEANAGAYIAELQKLDEGFAAAASSARCKTAVFADRFPFCYLFHDYGLEADAAFDGCSTDVDPSPAKLAYLYNKAKELGLPAILYMEGSDKKYAEELAAKLGGKALMLHSCHVLSQEEFEKESYLSLQKKNVEVLRAALCSDGENG